MEQRHLSMAESHRDMSEAHRHMLEAPQRAAEAHELLLHIIQTRQVGSGDSNDLSVVSQESQRRVEEAQRLVVDSQRLVTEAQRQLTEAQEQRTLEATQERMMQLQVDQIRMVQLMIQLQGDQIRMVQIQMSRRDNDHHLGASQEVISRLRVHTLKPTDLAQTDENNKENRLNDATKKQKKTGDCTSTQCLICMEDYQVGEKRMVLPTCHHGYHALCAERWLTTNASCPLCKERLPDC